MVSGIAVDKQSFGGLSYCLGDYGGAL
uniref:Uncharacterized protein n=1 Tax=Anguilla anguilla TaxID=7936 RepID=A0A0E9U1K4_ANGAN